MLAMNRLVATASDRIIGVLRQRIKLPAIVLQPKQLACVCAGSVAQQHLHIVGSRLLRDSPINKTVATKVIVAPNIRSQRDWDSRNLKQLRMRR